MSSYHFGGLFSDVFFEKEGETASRTAFCKGYTRFFSFFVRPVGLETKKVLQDKGGQPGGVGPFKRCGALKNRRKKFVFLELFYAFLEWRAFSKSL